ncbi:MAG: helix-turn-helix domain-containing protein [Nitrospira sp.]|nr:helix-turn-helix domain-containing protein [Nitrospira sp.]
MPKGISFSGKFKQTVVEDLRENHLSYAEAMRKYGVCGKMSIQKWERIYLEEGPEGLSVERRGRLSTGRPPKLDKKVEEDLIAEVQRLRAENDYLKKLNALVLEKQHQNRKRK